jgi:UDP-2,3-diacylglucosamine pyrophosphatase LpxH
MFYNYDMKTKNTFHDKVPSYPDVSFAVISDLHFYDTSLGSSGAAFQRTMDSEQKLLPESGELLDFTIKEIVSSGGVRFVLIPGDLTKDGELANHTVVAEKLKTFTDAGIAVYVIPGNHDINNPGAVSYSGDNTTPVTTINAENFAGIYASFGFNSAIMRDNDSLSYVVEPVSGMWLLALDSCRYGENKPGEEEIVAGKISQKTAIWIASVLKAAEVKNKAVMAMVHHGVVEHWKGQSKLHPDYLISDYAVFGKFLASWNVRLVFTGHYHAQDITLARFDEKFIYDIETGSLVTPPCPIRYAQIKDDVLSIRSDAIADKLRPGTDFAANARAFFKRNIKLKAASVLKRFKVSDKDTDYIAGAVGDAFYAHYCGDENLALRPPFDKSRLGLWGRFIYSQQKYVIDGLWKDLPPADNDVRLLLH